MTLDILSRGVILNFYVCLEFRIGKMERRDSNIAHFVEILLSAKCTEEGRIEQHSLHQSRGAGDRDY
jgi:hypothetical protein